MVAHRHTGRPEIRYRYDSDGRVTEQLNPAGLSYTYQYEKDRITITDSPTAVKCCTRRAKPG
nr:RHS repeat domain-containing protein [Escherichia coli]